MLFAYFLLAAAIAANLLSCSLLTASDGFTKPVQSVSGILLALINYIIIARVILTIDISITYAIWSAVGITVSALISVFYFKQRLTKTGVVCIGLIICGLLLIHLFGTM